MRPRLNKTDISGDGARFSIYDSFFQSCVMSEEKNEKNFDSRTADHPELSRAQKLASVRKMDWTCSYFQSMYIFMRNFRSIIFSSNKPMNRNVGNSAADECVTLADRRLYTNPGP